MLSESCTRVVRPCRLHFVLCRLLMAKTSDLRRRVVFVVPPLTGAGLSELLLFVSYHVHVLKKFQVTRGLY